MQQYVITEPYGMKILETNDMKHQMVYFPPLTNTALLGLSMEKFRKFMTVIKHEIIFISI